ncbi:HIT family protein [Staphylococcus cohnii]|mgnify:FL=1|uniref:HIT family protein n=2 Tax=Staphylococcus cohnii TaxID=29382 RepID=A0ABT6J2Q3_9STAP|nr:HIT family protein [Staphylococcus cohnii]TGP60283.1 HIT family protein [bacterium M00.F.Ca.ET.229.01.1.1]TGS36720.1 HIT family protein [bacterium M00.F.Ca.ET.180.01.1.1]AYX90180.1 HIT family protein [Staphylococcus cohnii]KKI62693.1 Histidine triad (HIT) nucleotide-binding protein [Staphylococcus cohnii subsp. cohnii]MCI2941768.1 HIT family protein [Staphylococcus cohnii]
MSETIFSKIINGEIPSYKVYEDEFVYAFLDISQVTKGHTLLVPKKISANIFETDSETMKHIGVALPKVANAIKNAFNPDGLNIIQNNGEFADQSVFHLHFHLLPRYENEVDGFGYKWETHEESIDDDQKKKIAEEIAAQFN